MKIITNLTQIVCQQQRSNMYHCISSQTVKSLYDSFLVEFCNREKYLQKTVDKLTTLFLDPVKRVLHCINNSLK